MLLFLYGGISWGVSVRSSTLKTFMKFYSTCFKFWLRLWYSDTSGLHWSHQILYGEDFLLFYNSLL